MKTQTTRQTVEVRGDGEGLISHAGAFLLSELADRTGLTAALGEAMAPTRARRSAHDPGAFLRDLAVAIADGGDCVSDLGVLRGQEALFGKVASESTAHRVIKSIEEGRLEEIRAARAKARRRAWDGGARPTELILDIDATFLGAHSEKEHAAGNYKGGFGFHPLLCFLCWPASCGRATPAQTPPPITSRSCRSPSSSYPRQTLDREILAQPPSAWQGPIEADGTERAGAWVIELSESVDLSSWPQGTRLIVRRERPHPGAQFQVFDAHGYRHTAFITDQEGTDIAALELRHRRHARVEDAVRAAKQCGMRNLPFSAFEHNQAWMELSLAPRTCSPGLAPFALMASSPWPSPSDCASASCTSPGELPALPGARS